MLRILIVDDDLAKVRHIARVIGSISGVTRESIDHASHLHGARTALRTSVYDLLVLDLLVPEFADSEPDPDGGVRLLREIRDRPERLHTPAYVIGVTQHASLRGIAAAVFEESTLAVLHYDQSSDDWERTLSAAIRHILAVRENRNFRAEGYRSSLSVVCALPLELDAIRRLPWNWEENVIRLQGDPTAYYRGWFERGGERHVVHAAAAPRMGMSAAAVLATKMILSFGPELIAMPGIAAGVPGTVELGDVVVADPAWDYGSGKWVEKDGAAGFETAPHHVGLDPSLRTAFSLLAEDSITLARIDAEWPADRPSTRLNVHVGPVASGAAVRADHDGVQRVLAQHRKAIGIEMEAYGVYVAAEEAAMPRPRPVAVKAVVDFADPNKRDTYQRYGAYVSAAVLRHVVERLI